MDAAYPSCVGGACYESASTCHQRPGICEVFEVVGDICVRTGGAVCSAGQACVAGRCEGGDCVDAAGNLRAAGFVCRAADLNSCDEPERCTGVSADCPVCRLGDGLCVLDAHCPGTHDASDYSCPLSLFASSCTRACPDGATTVACAGPLCPSVCAVAVE